MEKERYILIYNEDELGYSIIDTKEQFGFSDDIHSWDILCSLLNQQDARIKELESQVEKWKQDYKNCSKLEKNLTKEHQYCLDNWRACEQENQQLKENLKDIKKLQNAKVVEVLTDILVNLCSKYSTIFGNHDEPIRVLDVEQISDFIMSQIKKLRGNQ